MRFETSVLGTFAKKLGLPTMALATHKGNGLNPRRQGAVIAMAVVARGGRKILAIEQCRGVDALSPTIVLIDGQGGSVGQLIMGHTFGVCVT